MFQKLKKLKRLDKKYKLAWLQGVCQNGSALPESFPGCTIYDLKYGIDKTRGLKNPKGVSSLKPDSGGGV